MQKSAVISECGKYRYELTRVWDADLPMVCFIGLNPSTADAEKDDATIRKCIGFATRWGYGGILMLNLFAFRTVSPAVLKAARKHGEDVVGRWNPTNDLVTRYLARCNNEIPVIACWGRHEEGYGLHTASAWPYPMQCLGRNKDGSPRHPLMLPYTTERERYKQF